MVTAEAQEIVREQPWITTVGKAGWFAKGVVYVISGLLASLIVLRSFGWDDSGETGEASPTGAVREIAERPLGGPALILLALGLIVYALWRLISAVMPGPRELKVLAARIGYVVSAIVYATLAITAFRLVTASPKSEDGNSKVSDISRSIMERTGGRVLIGLIGAVLIAVALYRANKGRESDVTDEMDTSAMSPERRLWTRRLGSIGEVGRGMALALIGVFLIRAAMTYNAEEATGLDGALRRAAAGDWTRFLVAVVAIGFVCYGVFCLATFSRRRFEAPG